MKAHVNNADSRESRSTDERILACKEKVVAALNEADVPFSVMALILENLQMQVQMQMEMQKAAAASPTPGAQPPGRNSLAEGRS